MRLVFGCPSRHDAEHITHRLFVEMWVAKAARTTDYRQILAYPVVTHSH